MKTRLISALLLFLLAGQLFLGATPATLPQTKAGETLEHYPPSRESFFVVISTPREINISSQFLVLAFIANNYTETLIGVKARVTLSAGLALVDEEGEKEVGDMLPSTYRMLNWSIIAVQEGVWSVRVDAYDGSGTRTASDSLDVSVKLITTESPSQSTSGEWVLALEDPFDRLEPYWVHIDYLAPVYADARELGGEYGVREGYLWLNSFIETGWPEDISGGSQAVIHKVFNARDVKIEVRLMGISPFRATKPLVFWRLKDLRNYYLLEQSFASDYNIHYHTLSVVKDGVRRDLWTSGWHGRSMSGVWIKVIIEHIGPTITLRIYEGNSIVPTHEAMITDWLLIDSGSMGLGHHQPRASWLSTRGEARFDYIRVWTPIPKPDLSITAVKPVQVVWDCDIDDDKRIDLVQGKNTAVIVTVKVDKFRLLYDKPNVTVKLTYNDLVFYRSRSAVDMKIDELRLGGDYAREIAPDVLRYNFTFFFTPNTIGNYTISAEVDPYADINEFDEGNNQGTSLVTIMNTRALRLAYFEYPILWPPWVFQGLTEFSETVDESARFVMGTYPVGDDEFALSIAPRDYHIVPPLGEFCLKIDIIETFLWSKLHDPFSTDGVAIVPVDFFSKHGFPRVAGYAVLNVHGVLVKEGSWCVVAHELAHAYGLYHEISKLGDGFWVKQSKFMNLLCFMNESLPEDHYFLWICNNTYESLFKAFKVENDAAEVLLATGIIFRNGTVRLMKWYWLKDGVVDYVVPGNYSIQLLDLTGRILLETKFDVSYMAIKSDSSESEAAPFAFAIPHPTGTSRVVLKYFNVTLAEFMTIKLLHDAVDCIPDYGFRNNPAQRRQALHNKLDEVEVKIEQGQVRDAINKLRHDVRDKLEKWLVNYKKEVPTQLEKSEVLRLVDSIISSLGVEG